MWLLRAYLIAGLLCHKTVWEVLKRRSEKQRKAWQGVRLGLVKAAKLGILAGILAQALLPMDVLAMASDPVLLRTVGATIYSLGLLVAVLARIELGENWSNIETPEIGLTHSVRSEGMYRYIRHPIYVGDLFLLLGLE